MKERSNALFVLLKFQFVQFGLRRYVKIILDLILNSSILHNHYKIDALNNIDCEMVLLILFIHQYSKRLHKFHSTLFRNSIFH